MSKEMQDLFFELKQVLVQYSPKWNTLCDIEQYIQNLQHQLEEKDKVIDEAIEYAKNTKAIEYGESLDKYGREFFINEFWFIKDILKILEKDKEVK